METDQASPHGRLLIFIVAYNAERTIESVLKRIPHSLAERYDVEVLIIDDSSQDKHIHQKPTGQKIRGHPLQS